MSSNYSQSCGDLQEMEKMKSDTCGKPDSFDLKDEKKLVSSKQKKPDELVHPAF